MKEALGHVKKYEYDVNGNLIAVTDALGNSTIYTYTKLGEYKV